MQLRKLNIKVVFLILQIIFLGASYAQEKKIKILTTTNVVTDLVSQIARSDFELITLMGTGIDPHSYQPTARDVARIQQADVIFYVGHYLEAKLATILKKLRHKAYAVGENVPKNQLTFPDTNSNDADPHLWFDPILWKYTVDPVVSVLSKKRPDLSAILEQRGKKYKDQLEQIDLWTQQQVESLPSEKRVLVTPHDAFQYYAKRYQFQYFPIQGISTVTEASLSKIINLANFLSEKKIKAVFLETTTSPKTIQALVESVQSKNHEIIIGGTLYSDSLGKKGTKNDNLIGVIKHNTSTIIESLR